MRFLLSAGALGVIAVLCWGFYRYVAASRITAIVNRRRPTSRVVSSGEFVDGNRHLKVALALTKTDLLYENNDMQANLDLRWVKEIEYDTRLTTGPAVEGSEVLRIRCENQLFEFVVPADAAAAWHAALPSRSRPAPAGTTRVGGVAAAV